MPSKSTTLALVACLAYGSVVLSLPMQNSFDLAERDYDELDARMYDIEEFDARDVTPPASPAVPNSAAAVAVSEPKTTPSKATVAHHGEHKHSLNAHELPQDHDSTKPLGHARKPGHSVKGLRTSVKGHHAGIKGHRTTVKGHHTGVKGHRTSIKGHHTSAKGDHTNTKTHHKGNLKQHSNSKEHSNLKHRPSALNLKKQHGAKSESAPVTPVTPSLGSAPVTPVTPSLASAPVTPSVASASVAAPAPAAAAQVKLSARDGRHANGGGRKHGKGKHGKGKHGKGKGRHGKHGKGKHGAKAAAASAEPPTAAAPAEAAPAQDPAAAGPEVAARGLFSFLHRKKKVAADTSAASDFDLD
jgi:hypothetical protein